MREGGERVAESEEEWWRTIQLTESEEEYLIANGESKKKQVRVRNWRITNDRHLSLISLAARETKIWKFSIKWLAVHHKSRAVNKTRNVDEENDVATFGDKTKNDVARA